MDVLLPFFAQYYNEWSVLHMSENGNQSREWNSRFGYIMVAAGAAIGNVRNQQCNRWFKMLSPA